MPKFDKEYQGYLRGECKDYNQPLINALEEMEKGDKEDENDGINNLPSVDSGK